jgi:hypothetical protein
MNGKILNCSKCGSGNSAEVNFCRMCGNRFHKLLTNLPYEEKQMSEVRALTKLLIGLVLLFITFVPTLDGAPILWLLLFPSFLMIKKGILQLSKSQIELYSNCRQLATRLTYRLQTPSPHLAYNDFRAIPTGELTAPPSVTENTTKLFEK